MAEKFKPGDLVKLKSGGPTMTVERAISRDESGKFGVTYYCSWFSGAKDNHKTFFEAALKTAEAE